jgi:hypothetical protein
MAREWCVVLETLSPAAARRLGRRLIDDGVDTDVEARRARISCFASNEGAARDLERRILRLVEAMSEPTLQIAPTIRAWSDERHRYVDPAAPDEDPDSHELWVDSELAPGEVRWRVRLELASVFEFRRVRRQLPPLRRPVIDTGNRHIDLGTRDEADAAETARLTLALDGVTATTPSPIRGRLRRWLIRQKLAGNYAVGADGSGPGYGYSDLGGGGGGDGGGGGGHGGGGGGGHGGH